jgi:hypothetical protein
MNFRVSARTILHLWSELISSDGIAFYELIKNSLDARSTEVRVSILYRLDFRIYDAIMRVLGENRDDPVLTGTRSAQANTSCLSSDWLEQRQIVLDGLIAGTPDVEDLRAKFTDAVTRSAFLEALRDANQIKIDDDGEGMSMDLLEQVYLTIGTSHRAAQKRQMLQRANELGSSSDSAGLILGEKGLGRLSAMRLGDRVKIITGEHGSLHWNQLEIDWNDFADAADQSLESVDLSPNVGEAKKPEQTGTQIIISALRSEWSSEKLEKLAIDEFSRLIDPLEPGLSLLLRLTFNCNDISIPAFADFLLEHAHGHLIPRLSDQNP